MLKSLNISKRKKYRVLIVDDSALVRSTLSAIFNSDEDLEVIGTAANPYVAVELIKKELPDVITLDVEMPLMDGITFLSKIMSQHPIPVVIISTLTQRSAENAIMAMEYGAVEVIAKPQLGTKTLLESARFHLCDKVKAAAQAFVTRKVPSDLIRNKISAGPKTLNIQTTDKVVAIGASTGGTEAIRKLLMGMPLDCPGIIITQHMPEVFTKQFARRLDDLCAITVKEASNGDSVLRGQALIAPGHSHMRLRRSGSTYYVEVKDGPLVNRHKPSVDVLFESVAQFASRNAVGALLTGMGADGAKGMKLMHEAGAYTIAQDEASCVIYGMPKEAVKLNAVDISLPLEQIANHIIHKTKTQTNVRFEENRACSR